MSASGAKDGKSASYNVVYVTTRACRLATSLALFVSATMPPMLAWCQGQSWYDWIFND